MLAQAIISAVILALTNYLNASPAFACGFLLNLYGMYGIEIVDLARSGSNRGAAVVSDLLWTLGPHLHFADFTSRLTFSWGALPLDTFLERLPLLLRHSAAGQPGGAPVVEISLRLK